MFQTLFWHSMYMNPVALFLCNKMLFHCSKMLLRMGHFLCGIILCFPARKLTPFYILLISDKRLPKPIEALYANSYLTVFHYMPFENRLKQSPIAFLLESYFQSESLYIFLHLSNPFLFHIDSPQIFALPG